MVPPGHPCRFPFLFPFFSFFVFFPFLFVVLRVPFLVPFFVRFCPFVLPFSVLFLYRLLRFYFRFPAFLGGGFCRSVILSRRYTPPALLASVKYAYSPCVLSSVFFLSCVADVDLSSFFFFSSFPFSISIWTSFVFILYFSCGYYAVFPVSVSAATRLAYDMYVS